MIGIEARVLLPLDDGVLDLCELGRLLAALEGASQVSAAARALGISYRGAWGKLVRAERLLGVSLVERIKGHGSRLTAAGARWRAPAPGSSASRRAGSPRPRRACAPRSNRCTRSRNRRCGWRPATTCCCRRCAPAPTRRRAWRCASSARNTRSPRWRAAMPTWPDFTCRSRCRRCARGRRCFAMRRASSSR